MSAEQLKTNKDNNKTRKHTYTIFRNVLKKTYTSRFYDLQLQGKC